MNICIIGLGLIGGSLAKGLKASGHIGEIYAITRDKKVIAQALKDNAIDKGSDKYEKSILSNSDIVVLCTPIDTFSLTAELIEKKLKKGAIVTDVGSVKASVLFSVVPCLPKHAELVPAHPIAGKEQGGYQNSEPDLFRGKRTILTPLPNREPASTSKISLMWDSVGAVVEQMSAAEHDRIYASVSHVPQLLAYTYAMSVCNKRADIKLKEVELGADFAEFIRIAKSPTDIWKDIIFYNRPNINMVLTKFFTNLKFIDSCLNVSKASKKLGLEEKDYAELQPLEKKLGEKKFFWTQVFPILLSNCLLQTLDENQVVRKFTPADIHQSLEKLKVDAAPVLSKNIFDYAGTGLRSFCSFSSYTGIESAVKKYKDYIPLAQALIHRKIFEVTVAMESGHIEQLQEKLDEASQAFS